MQTIFQLNLLLLLSMCNLFNHTAVPSVFFTLQYQIASLTDIKTILVLLNAKASRLCHCAIRDIALYLVFLAHAFFFIYYTLNLCRNIKFLINRHFKTSNPLTKIFWYGNKEAIRTKIKSGSKENYKNYSSCTSKYLKVLKKTFVTYLAGNVTCRYTNIFFLRQKKLRTAICHKLINSTDTNMWNTKYIRVFCRLHYTSHIQFFLFQPRHITAWS